MPSRVRVSGPIFDGRASEAVTRWLADTRQDVGRQAAAIVTSKYARMNRSGRATGTHAASITTVHAATQTIVEGRSARGQIWWPWLEGTSHRNSSTRFKGYHAFRLAKNIAAKRARKTAQDKLNKYIEQMGGH